MSNAIIFEAVREGYDLDQIRNPITVRDLIDILEQFDEDDLVFLSHDNGYTYGTIPEDYEVRELDEQDE